ncbi:MAG: lipoyl synthase [Dehalococcoidia bacterium]|nr:lipoyl synthase [Dehalococcoidia bacterium]
MSTQHLEAPRKPPWLKVRFPGGPNYVEMKNLMRGLELHTVCEEAHCPNIGECWENRTATFMILGAVCTRRCAYCAVISGMPVGLDLHEPVRLAEAVQRMGLKHVVITSVNRDDLPDGGAAIFAACIRRVREKNPDCTIEVLVPDFKGSIESVAKVMAARPDVFNHNIETVPRLYRRVRSGGRYQRALDLLKEAKAINAEVLTKSGMIVGMGERFDELLQTMRDLREISCDILTIGQYLRPSQEHIVMDRYYTPEEFARLKEAGMAMGFKHVESGPLVRSSYHAWEQVQSAGASAAASI